MRCALPAADIFVIKVIKHVRKKARFVGFEPPRDGDQGQRRWIDGQIAPDVVAQRKIIDPHIHNDRFVGQTIIYDVERHAPPGRFDEIGVNGGQAHDHDHGDEKGSRRPCQVHQAVADQYRNHRRDHA